MFALLPCGLGGDRRRLPSLPPPFHFFPRSLRLCRLWRDELPASIQWRHGVANRRKVGPRPDVDPVVHARNTTNSCLHGAPMPRWRNRNKRGSSDSRGMCTVQGTCGQANGNVLVAANTIMAPGRRAGCVGLCRPRHFLYNRGGALPRVGVHRRLARRNCREFRRHSATSRMPRWQPSSQPASPPRVPQLLLEQLLLNRWRRR